jgi:hypothetical protein
MKKSIIVLSLIAFFVTTLVAVTPKSTKTTKEAAKTEVKANHCDKTDAAKACCDKKEVGCTAKVEGEKKDCAKKCSEGATATTDKKCCKDAAASADKKCCKGETAATAK